MPELAPNFVTEKAVNYNHLLNERETKMVCRKKRSNLCKWKPTSEGLATAGGNIGLNMLCETCEARTVVFMLKEEYEIHQKTVIKEVYNE